MLQWEWLGGVTPLRRAAVIGAGSWGTALAVAFARAGLDVELGCRSREQADAIAHVGRNERYLPGVELPDRVRAVPAAELELGAHDLVCLAVPARDLPAALAAHGARIPARAGVLVVSKGLVPPLGTLPAADALEHGASVVLATHDDAFAADLAAVLAKAGFDVHASRDVAGVELAGCAKNAAALAAATAHASAGPNLAGAAAGKVFAEIDQLARRRGAAPHTFAGLAGAGDLVATVVADGSRNRRAGELLAQGVPAADISHVLGHAAEAVDSVPLLAAMLDEAELSAPATAALAALVEGRLDLEAWTATVAAPARRAHKARAA
jgi:glycerol-3-phosphate dehydrogenase (NAD(P)+)